MMLSYLFNIIVTLMTGQEHSLPSQPSLMNSLNGCSLVLGLVYVEKNLLDHLYAPSR